MLVFGIVKNVWVGEQIYQLFITCPDPAGTGGFKNKKATGGVAFGNVFGLKLLFNTRGFTLAPFHIIQLGPAYFSAPYKLNFLYAGRNNGKNALYTNAIRYFAHGKGFAIGAFSPALDDHPLKLLDALLISFAYFHVNVNGVAGLEVGVFLAGGGGFLLNNFNQIGHKPVVW
jgi:hypothetical protein